jgi:release factor glutamine methyltransferase
MNIPRQFIAAAARLLKSGGFLAIEHHETHGDAIGLELQNDFDSIILHLDLNERPRFTTAVRK